jgi:hypothetical protein
VYEDVPEEDARPISQAEEIRNLRAEIKELKARIDGRQDGMCFFKPPPTCLWGFEAGCIANFYMQDQNRGTCSSSSSLKACLTLFDLHLSVWLRILFVSFVLLMVVLRRIWSLSDPGKAEKVCFMFM